MPDMNTPEDRIPDDKMPNDKFPDDKFPSKEDIERIFSREGVKQWESKAKEYIDNPEKTKELIDNATKKAEANRDGVLSNVWEKIQLLISLIKDWVNGNYKNISNTSIILVLVGLIYFVSPVDIIPDWIIGLGLIDDAAVLGLIINQVDKELIKYKLWKKSGSL